MELFYKKDDGRFRSVMVNSVRAVQDFKPKAVYEVINNNKNVCEQGLAEFNEMDVNDNQEPDGNYRHEQTMSSGYELCKKSCEMFDFSNTPKAKLSNVNALLKRLHSSPDEQESMELIKKFCKDHKLLETQNQF